MNYYWLWLLQNFMTTLEIRTKNLSRIHLKRDKTLTDKKKINCFTNLIPFSVNREGSNLRTFPSKNDLLISGSRSGSSPIN